MQNVWQVLATWTTLPSGSWTPRLEVLGQGFVTLPAASPINIPLVLRGADLVAGSADGAVNISVQGTGFDTLHMDANRSVWPDCGVCMELLEQGNCSS